MSSRLARSAGAAAVCVGLLMGPDAVVGAPLADQLQPPPDVAPRDSVEETMRFRRDMGLQSDRDFVLSVDGDPRSSSQEYGFALLPEETSYLLRHDDVSGRMGPINEYLGKEPTFAGVWMDNPGAVTDGVAVKLVVSFTEDPEAHRAALQTFMPSDSELELRSAKFTHAQLRAAMDSIEADYDQLLASGVTVYMTGIDQSQNRVLVGVSEQSTDAVQAIALRARAVTTYVYGTAAAELDACVRKNCPPPWPAGLNINNNVNPNVVAGHCTSGYNVQSGSGNWYMLTAGHCPGDHWWHNGTLMGVTPAGLNTMTVSNPAADAQAFDIAQGNHSNNVLTGTIACNPCAFRTMTSFQTAGTEVLGETTCISGAYSGSNCGVLKIKEANYDFPNWDGQGHTKHMVLQNTADYVRHPGDSGAPIFRSTLALGSHVNFQASTGWGVFSQIHYIQSALGLSMCFTGC